MTTTIFLHGGVKCLLHFQNRPQAITWTSEKTISKCIPIKSRKVLQNEFIYGDYTANYNEKCVLGMVNSDSALISETKVHVHTRAHAHVGYEVHGTANNTLSLLFTFLIY